MKILLVSDAESKFIWDYFQPDKFEDIDLIISCGDMKPQYLSFLVTMIRAPLYYVHGNHDDIYLERPPEGCDCIDGKIVKYKGIRILGLGGSIRYSDGIFQHTERKMNLRILKLRPQIYFNKGFDILVSHAPALGLGDGDDYCHQGFNSFRKLLEKFSPKYHFHGHQHLSYGRQERVIKHNGTTIINGYGYYILEY
ncbi:metallophosphoesterase [Wukongibacter baidiensis]|uniref:metallophosphoesterase family protein n=1 Tax=Wukongibacter baidiensis TaxID=1723361 RepID=UPI003D7F9EA6